MYSNCDSIDSAHRTFDDMPAKNQQHPQCRGQGMLRQVHAAAVVMGIVVNSIVCNTLVDGYGKCGQPDIACDVFERMKDQDTVYWTSMVVSFMRAGRKEDACRVFVQMPDKGSISWTSLIDGYAQNEFSIGALNMFILMVEEGVMPNAFTFVSLLSACADLALSARNLFDVMSKKDRVTWNSMITGYAQNGYAQNGYAQNGNLNLAETAAEALYEVELQNPARYVTLSHTYAAADRWDCHRIWKIVEDSGLRKELAYSWIEVRNERHSFTANSILHKQIDDIYDMVQSLVYQMSDTGYVPINFDWLLSEDG
ncbi:hypothetical protein QQ045_032767 [Rhodiola kirilowii]